MRAPTTVVPAVLSAAAGIALLAACGGSGGEPGAAPGSTADRSGSSGGSASAAAPGSSGASSASGETVAWCGQAVALSSDLQRTLSTAGSHPSQVGPVLRQAAAKYAGIDAPAPIERDWHQVVEAVQTLGAAAADIDFTAPDAGDRLAASLGGQQDALNTAATHVETFAQQNCPGRSAAPTS